MLKFLFPLVIMNAILILPMPQFVANDKLVCRFDKNECFTIKACYHRLHEAKFENGRLGFSYLITSKLGFRSIYGS